MVVFAPAQAGNVVVHIAGCRTFYLLLLYHYIPYSINLQA